MTHIFPSIFLFRSFSFFFYLSKWLVNIQPYLNVWDLNWIWIVIILYQLIWHQTVPTVMLFCAVFSIVIIVLFVMLFCAIVIIIFRLICHVISYCFPDAAHVLRCRLRRLRPRHRNGDRALPEGAGKVCNVGNLLFQRCMFPPFQHLLSERLTS